MRRIIAKYFEDFEVEVPRIGRTLDSNLYISTKVYGYLESHRYDTLKLSTYRGLQQRQAIATNLVLYYKFG